MDAVTLCEFYLVCKTYLQKVDKSIRRVCKTPLTSMYFHVCEKICRSSAS